MNKTYPLVWIIIGVSGSGKTELGRLLSKQLECDFIEGDRRHPPGNIDKMSNSIALDDNDRMEWLNEIKLAITEAIRQKRELVVTCSALKVKYREILNVSPQIKFIWPAVKTEIIENRISQRVHFMPTTLLASQISAFEEPLPSETIIEIENSESLALTFQNLMQEIIKHYPELKWPWWKRLAS